MRRASLNHVFRLVWHRRLAAFVPVAECSRGPGKNGRGTTPAVRGIWLLGLLSGCLLAPPVWAGGVVVAPDSGNTHVHSAPNGVTVVDIDQANRHGLSHNRFLDYNVDQRGLVLNNGDMSQVMRDSQLAGKILANKNLTDEARFILNEVVSTNPSALLGFTEVVGGRADVIIANPYGITCDGCGFINTDRVTLTTGTPGFLDEALHGFSVGQGQVSIGEGGLNASGQQYFDIVARSVKVAGALHAQTLGITAGASEWDYAERTASAGTATAPAPALAFDSTALGGMYARQIRIHATEQGVGVRMLGEAAATGADFTLNAAGQIEMAGAVSAARDLTVRTADSSAEALRLNQASLSAREGLLLDAEGGAVIQGGTLTAGTRLEVAAGSLRDSATESDQPDNNKRYGADGIEVRVTGASELEGVTWGAGEALAWQSGSVDVGPQGAVLYGASTVNIDTTLGDLALGDAAVLAGGDLTLSSAGSLHTGAGDAQRIVTEQGDLVVTAAGNIDNQGLMAAGDGDVTLAADGTVGNHGTLYARQEMSLAGAGGGAAGAVNNSGLIQSDATLTLHAQQLANAEQGVVLAAQGSTIRAGDFRNQGIFVASNDAARTAQLFVDSLHNQGTLQAAGDLHGDFAMLLDNNGELLAGGAMALLGGAGAVTLHNSGIVQAGGNIRIAGDGASGSLGALGTLKVQLSDEGVLLADELEIYAQSLTVADQARVGSHSGMTLTLDELTVADAGAAIIGATSGSGDMTLSVSDQLSNQGAIHSGTSLTIAAGDVHNSATAGISALDTLAISAGQGDLENAGALYAGELLLLEAADSVVNRDTGTVDSGDAISSESQHFLNNGRVTAAGDIALTALQSFTNETTYNGEQIRKELGPPTNARNRTSNQVAFEGTGNKGMNVWLEEDEITRRERLVGITETELEELDKAQIVSTEGGTLTINYGSEALNRIALLSADTVQIVGGENGVFVNESMALHTYELKRRWLFIEDNKSGDDYYLIWARTNPNRSGYNGDVKDSSNDPDKDNFVYNDWSPGWGWESTDVWAYNGTPPTSLRNEMYREGQALANQGAVETSVQRTRTFGAGIYSNTLSVHSGRIENRGSPYQTLDKIREGTPVGGQISDRDMQAVAGITLGSFDDGIQHLPVNLPTNPNGYFVPARDPDADYLVETNPLFTDGDHLASSNLLAEYLGLDLDDIGMRLGDAGYEAYLIRQQLISQTGTTLLAGHASEQAMIGALYAAGANASDQLGLTWGKPLTDEQVGALTEDIVWMVETDVDGKRVLAPVVYLSQATRDGIRTGAVIAADTIDMQVDGLSNIGGDIVGRDSLNIVSQDDILNLSGSITGGDVSLISEEGSIRNETLARSGGDDISDATVIGRTGEIGATGNLLLDAADDIENIGAHMHADGSAVLQAGGDVLFDTIVDRRASTDFDGKANNYTTENRITETHIGSQLGIGENLVIRSGGDTTFAGSDVDVQGNLALESGGSVYVLARQDTDTTNTVERRQGRGVGGGVWGRETTTTHEFTGTNVGSTLRIGGDALIDSGGDITLLGSEVVIGGNAALLAEQDINILDGLDEHYSHTKKETETFLSVRSSGKADAKADASAQAGNAAASARASASASAGNNTELSIWRREVTETEISQGTSVASQLSVGGSLTANAGQDITVQGSDVSAADMRLDAENVNVLAGRDHYSENTTTTTTSIGLFIDSKAGAEVGANTGAIGMTPNASAGANAGASAGVTGTAGWRRRTSEENTESVTHRGATLTARDGSVDIQARDTATFQAADVSATEHIVIDATDIHNLAAEDSHVTTSSSTTQTAGLYYTGSANANASAGAQGGVLGGKAEASASASASQGAGIRYGRQESSAEEGSTRAITSSFSAGGDIRRTASGTLVDEGTQLSAGNNIIQRAGTLEERAVSDSNWSTSSEVSHEARLGVYGEGKVSAGASAQVGLGAASQAKPKVEGGAGVQASYQYNRADSDERSTTAVTTRYQAGGNIISEVTGDATLIGTQMDAGGDIRLTADTLDFQAAESTSSSTTLDRSGQGGVKVDAVNRSVAVSGGYGNERDTQTSSEAVTGSLAAGGNVVIGGRGDVTLEGAAVQAGGGIDVSSSEGSLNLEAAESTSTRRIDGFNVSAEVKVGKKADSNSIGAEGGMNRLRASETDRTGVSFSSGGGDVNLSAGEDLSAEGMTIDAQGGEVTLRAGGAVELLEALDEADSNHQSFAVKGKVSAKEQSGSASVRAGGQTLRQGEVTEISGGNVTIEGREVITQDTEIESDRLEIRGERETLSRSNKRSGYEIGFDVGAIRKAPEEPETPAGDNNTPPPSPPLPPAQNSTPGGGTTPKR